MKLSFRKFALLLLQMFIAISQIPCFGQTNSLARLPHVDTPPAYKEAMAKLMLSEVNDYASALNLPEQFPIATDSLNEVFVTPPSFAESYGALGSLRTTNFFYGFGRGKHLCYITRLIKGNNPYDYDANKPYAIDPSAVNTNAAYLLATKWLATAFVDVARLSTSSVVSVKPWVILHMTTSKYTVEWQQAGRPIVKVVLAEPKAELWSLRVEEPDYILRKPLEVANLDLLLSQTNAPAPTNNSMPPSVDITNFISGTSAVQRLP
jgi:hypothetical protein